MRWGSKELVSFSAPLLLESEQRPAGMLRLVPTRSCCPLGEGFMGGREAKGLGFPQRGGHKQPGFTDPCYHPLGWRNRSVAAFHRTPAPPTLGVWGKSQNPEGRGLPLPTAHPVLKNGSSFLPDTCPPQSFPGFYNLCSDP